MDGAGRASSEARAELIVLGATLHTVDPASAQAEAFAVHAGRFAFVGSREGALRLKGARTQVVDLTGKVVLPGLVDSHLHLIALGFDLQTVALEHVASFEEVVRRTAAFAKTSPDPWVQGSGWDQNLWPGQQFPTHTALSAALPDRPVVLYRVDGHALLANAAAMRLANVNAGTATPSGGRIEHDAAGQPTGVFIDNAMTLVEHAVPAPTSDQLQRAARKGIAECHRFGITSIGEANTAADHLSTFETLGLSGHLDLRVYTMLGDHPELLERELAAGPRNALYDGRLWVRAVKMFSDGALGSRGAALFEPYSDDPANTGLLRITPEHARSVAQKCLAAGFQVCMHAIGDRGNRLALDAYEAVLSGQPMQHDLRWRIEHAQVLEAQDIPRFARLGVIPSMQTTHQVSDMGWAQERLGPQRVRGAYAWRSLLDTGVIVPNGTDAPVETVNTARSFHAAITRQNEHNQPAGGWYPEQRMSREEALKAMTIWGAHASFREHLIGSISPGKYADFVVMDNDWMTVAPDELMQTRVLATYFAGKQVHDAADPTPAARTSTLPRHGTCGCTKPAAT